MTEMLDVYDANRKLLGTADRNVVHATGLWHKTVHCWLVWQGKMLFQRRARALDNNPGKLYTTASGHVSAGESLEDAFRREVAQEIGLKPDSEKASAPHHLHETVWIADITKTDGKLFCDRVFANVYYAVYSGELSDFKFTDGEVDGIVAIDLEKFIEFSHSPRGQISALEFDGAQIREITLGENEFVINAGEDIYNKYGQKAEQILMGLAQ
ncbi:MAG: NUDIX domain-containing protein [Alphaproteobacteria bacterium]|nr:NUDIX domain-containing protein [Alphaproteobacteria bacterium]